MSAESLGARIAQARRELSVRERRDISPSDVATALGVAPATVYRWEGDEKSPREDALAKLADYLGVTPAYLRYGVRDAEAAPSAPQVTATPQIGETGAEYLARMAKEKAASQGGRKKANGGKR